MNTTNDPRIDGTGRVWIGRRDIGTARQQDNYMGGFWVARDRWGKKTSHATRTAAIARLVEREAQR